MKTDRWEVVVGLVVWSVIAFAVGGWAFSGAKKESAKPQAVASSPSSLEDSAIGDRLLMHPAPDGGVYFVGMNAVWLMKGNEAVRVKEVPTFTHRETGASRP